MTTTISQEDIKVHIKNLTNKLDLQTQEEFRASLSRAKDYGVSYDILVNSSHKIKVEFASMAKGRLRLLMIEICKFQYACHKKEYHLFHFPDGYEKNFNNKKFNIWLKEVITYGSMRLPRMLAQQIHEDEACNLYEVSNALDFDVNLL